jgi:hypothetical protein
MDSCFQHQHYGKTVVWVITCMSINFIFGVVIGMAIQEMAKIKNKLNGFANV